MKVFVEVEFRGAAFEDDPSLVTREVFEQVTVKAMRQSYRLLSTICEALEEDAASCSMQSEQQD